MNIRGLQVSSSRLRVILRLERIISTNGKKDVKFGLEIVCFVLDEVCLLSQWFSLCGCFFGAYWYLLSVETVCKLFKLLKSKWLTELQY